ncbi:MAG: LysR substrate-binding domain-containing protein [Anaerolineales bacterium]|nr:LysR substrate-binding domain-containing protein [Anaerolineales bacterium]NUQ83200.1 LysR family transcriptional regulator [Anaerolineales bacterium]
MLDINRLNVFIQVAATQSCSEAAKRLHLSQPTVSKHIQNLEAELNVQLFVREGAQLRITNAGMTLLPWARKIVRQSTEVQEMMQAMQDSVVGQLRIACTTTAGKYILPHLAARFRQRYPGVQIFIQPCVRQEMTSRLLSEDADLGVVSSEVRENDLECQYFFTDYISFIVPEKHPLSKRDSIEPAELLDVPIILREPSSGTRRTLQAELAKYDISFDEMNVLMEVGNAEAIVLAVAGNLGVSFVSRMASAYARVWGCVVDVPVEGLNLQRRICIARRKLSHPNLVRDAFWAFIHAPENEDVLALPEA